MYIYMCVCVCVCVCVCCAFVGLDNKYFDMFRCIYINFGESFLIYVYIYIYYSYKINNI